MKNIANTMIVAYAVPFPEENVTPVNPYPSRLIPYDEDTGPVKSVEAQHDDPFDFLRPLLERGVKPATACRLWAKFKNASMVIVELAAYKECTIEEILDNVEFRRNVLDDIRAI